jgi:hypothetical protein
MSRTTTIVAAAALSCAAAASAQNMIINPSFESNTAGGSMSNMSNATFNATVNNATAFGAANEIDLYQGNPFGLPPVHGQWKLAIHKQSTGAVDAFSFDLNNNIVAGQLYHLEFSAHAETTFDPGTQPVEIGISNSAAAFGTLVYTSGALAVNSWTQYTTNFVAPVNASYLTVQNSQGTNTWAHIDDFRLTLVPAPSSLALLGLGGVACARRRRA